VDGLRLDAIPYLCEREGTNNENLRETHEVIKELRAAIDERYTGRMLLGEANQWPEDVRDYFGGGGGSGPGAAGDECHMAFHFPLMPRMYMAIAQEDRHPIVEIMQQTPDIPQNCQWAIFLRNHDELTLEMVTSKERDYMYRMYAADQRARINLGIRRRLAPLMENDPERVKLMNSLLLSMPGAPIIYYGDEIGMGDNIFLGDRNGVRTPMQWSPDRNAGFSRADPQQLYLPPIMDPVYGYQAVNVEAQQRDPSSLLNWMKRMLRVRGASQAFGRGTLTFLRPGNRKILAYIREYGNDNILCVANLARTAQAVELDLAGYKECVPVEMLGRTPFPPIGELPYLLTLPGYAFFWFRLSSSAETPPWHEERLPRKQLPTLVLFEGWNSLFRERVAPHRAEMAERVRRQLETEALPAYLGAQRAVAPQAATIARAALVDHCEWQPGQQRWLLAALQADGPRQLPRYFVPMTLIWENGAEAGLRALLPNAIARVRQQAEVGVLGDALGEEAFCYALVDAIGAGSRIGWAGGAMRCFHTEAYAQIVTAPAGSFAVDVAEPDTRWHAHPLTSQGATVVVRLGDALVLKVRRWLHPGVDPELELTRYLATQDRFTRYPPLLGGIEYATAGDTPATLALLQSFVPNQGDAWHYTLDYLARFFERHDTAVSPDPGLAPQPLPGVHGGYLSLIETLGLRTAQLHLALANATDETDFSPEPVQATDLTAWSTQARDTLHATFDRLAAVLQQLPPGTTPLAQRVLARRESLTQQIGQVDPAGQVGHAGAAGLKIRHHGDYHLDQVMVRRNDFIIDFEGVPGRAPGRWRRHSPLRDLAGMLRAFAAARFTALHAHAVELQRDYDALTPPARGWEQATRAAFLDAYAREVRGSSLYGDFDQTTALLEMFEIERACCELHGQLDTDTGALDTSLLSLLDIGAPQPGL
jgi:maltose alpha-D-glucosyltransferase/alpha-amylase